MLYYKNIKIIWRKKKMKNDCFSFIKFCNERIANSNDYNIARTIINHIEDIKILSLEKIAEEANISPASVSRFINKAGFESFQAFKYEFELFTRDVKMRRIISHTQRFMRTTIENMSESLYVDGLANLRQTKLNLDIDKLKEIVKLLKTSKSVTFIGDSHELADFYTLQLEMLVNDIPAYLINFYEFEKMYLNQLDHKDTIVFIGVYKEWFSDAQKEILDYAKERKIKIIAFVQEEDYLKEYADLLYVYGIPDSYNDGYYSLPYLNRLLCEMIYFKL